MLSSRDIDFYASILNSLLTRRPFFLVAEGRKTERLVKHVLSFVPAHRYLLVAGAIPRWARFLASQPRELQSADLQELSAALRSTFDEERMGRRPVQLIYFGSDAGVYEAVLKTLPSAWIATTDQRDWLRSFTSTGQECHELEGPEGLSVVHLGARQRNLEFEAGLLERARDRHGSFATFLIQMKFTQLHLAAAAVLGEWEERAHRMTTVDLQEDFELDALSLEKMFELAQAEHGLEVRRCLRLAEPEVVRMADELARVEHVAAVAVADNGEVVWLKRVASLETNVSCVASHAARFMQTALTESVFGKLLYIWLSSSAGHHIVAMKKANVTYVILLAPDAKPALATAALSEVLGQ